MEYNPVNWYWIVGDDNTKVYSSSFGDYVLVDNPTYVQWVSSGGHATRIASEAELAEVLDNARVRPNNAGLLDLYKTSQASKLTLELIAKVLFNHENRIRQAQGQQTITANQFANALKAML